MLETEAIREKKRELSHMIKNLNRKEQYLDKLEEKKRLQISKSISILENVRG